MESREMILLLPNAMAKFLANYGNCFLLPLHAIMVPYLTYPGLGCVMAKRGEVLEARPASSTSIPASITILLTSYTNRKGNPNPRHLPNHDSFLGT